MKILATMCLALTACIPIGGSVGSSPMVTEPGGAHGYVTLGQGGKTMIEVLMVSDSSVVVQTASGRIAEATFDEITDMKVDGIGLTMSGNGVRQKQHAIRMRSRFPYGVTPETLALVLKKAGQDSIVRLRDTQ